ncbi:cation:proton antiporter [uncultured Ruminococcus sp.]|uniref:cation:proton antiporter n=1 Tax=uncultured Ruminococcus sp. TaxID=165186 RepID=UPI0025EFF034|nr:cation:proton antiporter [uncultured Ruminococcus sp.]
MEEYNYILFLAIILLSTKILGLVTKKLKLPQVVGALCAGVILGPAVLNVVGETEFISDLSELGVIVLMFTAGLQTDISDLKKTGKASFIIALLGVIVPLLGGFGLAAAFGVGKGENLSSSLTLQHIFIGIVLTATSVSITVETLKELGKLSTRAGNAILGAAIIDDILGIIALTLITSLADTSVSVVTVLLKILAFFVVAIGCTVAYHIVFTKWRKRDKKDLRRHVIVTFVFCLGMSYIAEFFGVADITGSFVAGLAISQAKDVAYISNRFETLSYMLLSPIFFASIGLNMGHISMDSKMVIFTILLLVVAVITKIIGCGLGAKVCKYTNKESVQIAMGMISRGEVALIVAAKGQKLGLMSDAVFAPIVIMVVATTIITPIFLKIVFKDSNDEIVETEVLKGKSQFEEYERETQEALLKNENSDN